MNGSHQQRGLTIRQAAEVAGVSRRTIYNWLTRGKLDTWRTVGGAVRIDPASLFQPTLSTTAHAHSMNDA